LDPCQQESSQSYSTCGIEAPLPHQLPDLIFFPSLTLLPGMPVSGTQTAAR